MVELSNFVQIWKLKRKTNNFFVWNLVRLIDMSQTQNLIIFMRIYINLREKSVYYIIKVIFIVTKKRQLTTKNKKKVLERFELIGTITSEVINITHNKIKYMSMPLTELSKRSSTYFFIDCFYQIVIVRNCLVDISNISFSLSPLNIPISICSWGDVSGLNCKYFLGCYPSIPNIPSCARVSKSVRMSEMSLDLKYARWGRINMRR